MSVLRTTIAGLAIAAATDAGAQGRIVVSDVTVIDATGAPPRPPAFVTIENGRVTAIASVAPRTSSDVLVVDGRGKFLIPGLWDMHVHLAKAGGHVLPMFVANGVTSVRDMGSDFDSILAMRREIFAGTRVGPRIKSSGPILESARKYDRMIRGGTVEPVARLRVRVADSISATRAVDSLADVGVDFLKLRTAASDEAYRAIAAAARRRQLRLAGHVEGVSLDAALLGGQRSIEHALLPPLHWRLGSDRRRLVRQLRANDVAFVPTVVNFHQFFMTPRPRAIAIIDDSLGVREPRRRYLCCSLIQDWREQMEDLGGSVSLRRQIVRWLYGGFLNDLRMLHRAGVSIMPGTDVAVAMIYPGFSLHDELRYFVEEIGMTPMETLISATRKPAEWFGMTDSIGTIEVGKLADLVLLDSNPLIDIGNSRRIAGVFLRGRYFDRAALSALLEGVASEAHTLSRR